MSHAELRHLRQLAMMLSQKQSPDVFEVDAIVVGSGAGALLTAVRAHDAGLSVLVVEKTSLVGGTSAVSGGGIWIPNNEDMEKQGITDSVEKAFNYLRACSAGLVCEDRILAYVETARDMTAYLVSLGINFRCMPRYADYYPQIADSLPGGRTMDPGVFNAARLGRESLSQMRDTNPGQKMMGRVLITAFDARPLIAREAGSLVLALKLMLRYWLDVPWRFFTRRDRRLTGGQALIGGLFTAVRNRNIPLWLNAPMQSLTLDSGRVTGCMVQRNGISVRIEVRKGVVLGAGGFERNQAMRERYLPQPTSEQWTATPLDCNTGDAIIAGQNIGAAVDLMAHSWGSPTVQVPSESVYRSVFVERSMPGCMVVNSQGKRFVNESCPYPEFQQAMLANQAASGGTIPAWIIFDSKFRKKYPMGPLLPGIAMPDSKLPSAWLGRLYWKAESLSELAQQIGVDVSGLLSSVARMNDFAKSGEDLDFGRGSNVYDRYYADDSVVPNPNLAAIDIGPFYAMKFWPGDIGTKGGLLTNRDGQVLNTTGQIISGLYCIGNNSSAVTGPAYPGAGSTLGPAMTFGFRAVAHMLGCSISLKRTDLLTKTE